MSALGSLGDALAVQIVRAPESERSAIERMLGPYLRELGSYQEGRTIDVWGYPYLKLYWSEPDRFPFTIRVDGEVAGFVLVRRISREDRESMEVAEFFVTERWRRRGVGTAAARALWDRFPGEWELQVLVRNEPAVAFWHDCIAEHATGVIDVHEFRAVDGPRLRYHFRVD